MSVILVQIPYPFSILQLTDLAGIIAVGAGPNGIKHIIQATVKYTLPIRYQEQFPS